MTDATSTSTHLGSGADAMAAGSWYDDAYYQILLVEPDNQRPGKRIKTTIVVGQRTKQTSLYKNFSSYKLDDKTIKKLGSYPKPPDFDDKNISIGTYLPSPGVIFPKGFIENLGRKHVAGKNLPIELLYDYSIEVNNFYDPIRTLLHTRKTSQLIAKTWYDYLYAKKQSKGELWNSFVTGTWDKFGDETDILDGLIAREIFHADENSSSDHLEPEGLDIYYPLKSQYDNQKTRFLILPNSKAWQGITLSLLLAGQAYYRVDKEGKDKNETPTEAIYHQICQPILSTGEIVTKYGLEVCWDIFKGDIVEMGLSPGNNSVAYKAIIPYPPIPSEDNLSMDDIKAWAYAQDEPTQRNTNAEDNLPELPFYYKASDGKFLVDVQYFSPPFPYLPLSCS